MCYSFCRLFALLLSDYFLSTVIRRLECIPHSRVIVSGYSCPAQELAAILPGASVIALIACEPSGQVYFREELCWLVTKLTTFAPRPAHKLGSLPTLSFYSSVFVFLCFMLNQRVCAWVWTGRGWGLLVLEFEAAFKYGFTLI